jgi:hypothetical protein
MKIPDVYDLYKRSDGVKDTTEGLYVKALPTPTQLMLAEQLKAFRPQLMYNLNATNSPKSFFAAELELAHETPVEWQPNVFWMLKLGYYVEGVPCEITAVVEWLDNTYGTVNALANAFTPAQILKLFGGQENCIMSMKDMVSRILDRSFTPIRDIVYKVPNGDIYDVYIESTDRIALMQASLADKLEHADIESITEEKGVLCLGTRPVATLLGGVGATHGIYDLSRVL